MLDEILAPVIGLVGVLVGGFVSYLTQTKNDKRIEKRNDKRQKYIAYNKYLLLEGISSPLVYGVHSDSERDFSWETYAEGTREIFFKNLHLFNESIVRNVLELDYISEEAKVMGPEDIHIHRMYTLYEEIKILIERDYRNGIAVSADHSC